MVHGLRSLATDAEGGTDLCFRTMAALSESNRSNSSDEREPALLTLTVLLLSFFLGTAG